jgi:hypothetical protein
VLPETGVCQTDLEAGSCGGGSCGVPTGVKEQEEELVLVGAGVEAGTGAVACCG